MSTRDRWQNPRTLIVGFVAIVAIAAAGWAWFASSRSGAQDVGSLVVAEARTEAMGLLYIADDQGFFGRYGLDVTLEEYPSGRDAIQAVFDGDADVGTPYDGPAVLHMNQADPLLLLTTLAFTPKSTVLVARRDAGITDANDLAGRRIGVIANSNADYLLSLVLAASGLDPTDVERQAVMPEEAVEAFEQGSLDAVSVWAPWWQAARDALGEDEVVLFTSPTYLEFALLGTRAEVVDERRSALLALIRALSDAEDFMHARPSEARTIIQGYLADKYTSAAFDERWEVTQLVLTLNHQMLVSLESQARWFADQGGMGTAPDDVRQFIDGTLLRTTRREAVTLEPR